MFSKLLIANRGEIACRIISTARRMGIATVAVYSDVDGRAPHVRLADESVAIGPAPAGESYLVAEKILDAARQTGANALHPGYGFLSENTGFARAVEQAGIAFVGPSPEAIAAMGDKIESREYAQRAGVNIIPGVAVATVKDAASAAREIGYPVMIKAAAGGGGKGMRVVQEENALAQSFEACVREAESSFGDGRVLLERYITAPRHIEIQLLADKHDNILHLGERECSIQRRNQKIIEEAPSPFVTDEMRAQMSEQAVSLARAVGYHSAGTVEFVADDKRNFHFLEMNTRLQVEHPVSELITGLDLVEWMLRVAAGEKIPFTQKEIHFRGWAMESRIYAEDPYRDFMPSPGRLSCYRPPSQEDFGIKDARIRNDTGVEEGGRISPHYDPMIAKLCTWAPKRDGAIACMSEALDRFEIDGIAHNIPLLGALMENERFRSGRLTTHFLEEEYPGGFNGVAPDAGRALHLVVIALYMEHLDCNRDNRDAELSRHVETEVLSGLGNCRGNIVSFAGEEMEVESDWHPGLATFDGKLNGVRMAVSVVREKEGYTLSYRGTFVRVLLRSARAAELMASIPKALSGSGESDSSRHLLCPMPGVVVSISVLEGDEVRSGDVLAVVEAMKMQNILHAENPGRVSRVLCSPGQQLAVGDVMIEFE